MKIKSKIDEIVCTSVTVSNLTQTPVISFSIGYKANGTRLGELSIDALVPEGELREVVDLLINNLEKKYASVWAEDEGSERTEQLEITGIVKEF